MGTFKSLTDLGFSSTTITHDVWGLKTETRVYVRPGTDTGRTFYFIAGYLQPASCWSGLIENVWGRTKGVDTLIVLARRGEATQPRSRLTGLLPLGWQQTEVRSATLHLINKKLLPENSTIVGHSLGALLARHTVEIFPKTFGKIIQIAPTPDTRWSLLFNRAFWENGGLVALPSALKGLFLPWYGVRLAKKHLQTLFAGERIPHDCLDTYHGKCLPDSAILFTQLLVMYRGYELIRAHQAGWAGGATYVSCPADAITLNEEIQELVDNHERAGIPTKHFALAYQTPHCWFANEFWEKANSEHWPDIFAYK